MCSFALALLFCTFFVNRNFVLVFAAQVCFSTPWLLDLVMMVHQVMLIVIIPGKMILRYNISLCSTFYIHLMHFPRIKRGKLEIEIPIGNGRACRGQSTVCRVSTSTHLRIFTTCNQTILKRYTTSYM
jgi:hypothetical protein